jgi:hypothetical protein
VHRIDDDDDDKQDRYQFRIAAVYFIDNVGSQSHASVDITASSRG